MSFLSDEYQYIRDGVQGLCAQFSPEYHRKVDEEKKKVWISRVQHSDFMILLARTTPLAKPV